MTDHSEARVGLCGWTIAMSSYVRRFPLVEVQHTFYEPPTDPVLKRWCLQAPTGFEFMVMQTRHRCPHGRLHRARARRAGVHQRQGQPLRRARFRRSWWQPSVKAAGLEPRTFHELRHTFVSLWVMLGADVGEISERAGH